MSDYVLSCCSTADLSKEHFQQRDIKYICFHYFIDDEEYPDDLGESMPFDVFYDRMSKGAITRTSQVNISEYVDYFSGFAQKGLDIVHACLSSGISGTINSARNAALIVKERYPERNIYIVDSLAASSGYGLLMDAAADKRDEGLSAKELADWIDANKLKLNHWWRTYIQDRRGLRRTAGDLPADERGQSGPAHSQVQDTHQEAGHKRDSEHDGEMCQGWPELQR